MSISSAMSNALSGLTATGRTAELISNNIANALTDNFGRRDLTLTSEVLGGYGSGVRIGNVQRAEDVIATASRRAMDSLAANVGAKNSALSRITGSIGVPGSSGSLPVVFSAFEAALVAAANHPSSQTHLDAVVTRANELTSLMNRMSSENAQVRMDTDGEIGRQVATLNANLEEIDRLNLEIRKRINGPGDVASLQDTRKRLIDEVAEIIPVKVAKRDHGQVALFTPEGGVLLDDTPRLFSFSPTPIITHNMTIGNGGVSGLDHNGTPTAIGAGNGYFEGGSLSALFEVRDAILPGHNAQLDALGRDLIERFQDPAVDTTLLATDAGLFTDAGAAFAPVNEVGLAGRLSVNALADPGQGGASWRLRDGLNAGVQGPVGQNMILRNLESAMTTARPPGPNMGMSVSVSATGFAGELAGLRYSDQTLSDERLAYANVERANLKNTESALTGVDSDQQLQSLLEIEKAYAANARVMSVLDGLMEQLLRI